MGAVERLAAGEELVVHREDGGHAQGVALAAPYGRPLVERGALDGLQLGGAEKVGALFTENKVLQVSGASPVARATATAKKLRG
ncbi:hypothetical protein M2271_008293 [Streptomyces sp. LBL]|uniref:hypothetical protein n=1 Tax=Streptomyces sp. LBL TaxID=2940562 RepID=UPI002476FE4A|nr:hypothetical protein [Streptomyces sp. LBL]MDH6630433.1 hypothetical protein [Streptomyces sp. LBL]